MSNADFFAALEEDFADTERAVGQEEIMNLAAQFNNSIRENTQAIYQMQELMPQLPNSRIVSMVEALKIMGGSHLEDTIGRLSGIQDPEERARHMDELRRGMGDTSDDVT